MYDALMIGEVLFGALASVAALFDFQEEMPMIN